MLSPLPSSAFEPAPDRPRVLDANRLGDHLDRLYRAALGMTGSPADAEDLVQDVCVKVLAKPRLVTGDDDLGYLLRVLRNTFISGRRTAARRPATATAPEDLDRHEANGGADPERAFEARELYARIATARPPARRARVRRPARPVLQGGGRHAGRPHRHDHEPAVPRPQGAHRLNRLNIPQRSG